VDLRDPDSEARVPVAVSVGFAIYPAEAERIEDLIKLADSAMYAWRRQRPVLSTVRVPPRSLGGDRAAKMVGEIVPLLTSSGEVNDKLRLVAHRVSVGAGYDAVNFQLFSDPSEAPTGQNTFAKVPNEIVEAWNRAQRQTTNVPMRRILERTHRPIIVDDPQHDQRLTRGQRELLRAARLRSALVAPMIWQNELIGHVSVASRRERAFGPLDAEFLMAVAAQVTAIVRLATLVDELQSTSSRLAQGQTETVVMLAAAAEAHDQATGLHLQNVRAVTKALASDLGYSEEDASELGLAAVLHDIGKIRVPDVVLSTAGQLTDPEWELMKQHTVWGGDFLAGRQGFELAATIARSHHERWDGSGYPDGLAGEAIPKAATIVAVADAFDAMTSDRPYRAARPVAAAVREIAACSRGQFSPRVVQALVRLHRRRRLPRLRRQALGKLAA
jgi:HD-GYP domain-containing protein (c-di-GMP phosphodiesterase class II)